MKVFDYTNGRKGDLLGEVKRVTYCEGHPFHDGKFMTIGGKQVPQTEWSMHTGAGYRDTPLTPEQFGVEAICFCTGQISSGRDSGTWIWEVVGTSAWIDKAIESGLLVAKNLD